MFFCSCSAASQRGRVFFIQPSWHRFSSIFHLWLSIDFRWHGGRDCFFLTIYELARMGVRSRVSALILIAVFHLLYIYLWNAFEFF